MRKTLFKSVPPILAALAALAAIVAPWASQAAGFQDENLIVTIPNEFQVGSHGDQGPMAIAEYVPRGETVSAWSRMITVQVFPA
jgi:hypothetical protein